MLLNTYFVLILFVIVFIWLSVFSFFFLKAYSKYRQLTDGIDKKDFATSLAEAKKQLKLTQKEIDKVNQELTSINQRLKTHIQKLGFVRYNPFGNTGGDQSFCLCLLDEANNGILITSLHTRQQTRIYTKQITQGKSAEKASLSKEEALAIKKANQWSQQ